MDAENIDRPPKRQRSDSPAPSGNREILPQPCSPGNENIPPKFAELQSLQEEAIEWYITTAILPIRALIPRWTAGTNRPLNPDRVQQLTENWTAHGGRPRRESPMHHIVIFAPAPEMHRMLQWLRGAERLGLSKLRQGRPNLQDFSNCAIDPNCTLELVSGQHRAAALERLMRTRGLDEKDELWWPCRIYDNGE